MDGMDTTCVICFADVWVRPISLICGHVFCKKCLMATTKVDGKRACAVCRAPFVNKLSALTPRPLLCALIAERAMRCEYCEAPMAHKEYAEHLNACAKRLTRCDHVVSTFTCAKGSIVEIAHVRDETSAEVPCETREVDVPTVVYLYDGSFGG